MNEFAQKVIYTPIPSGHAGVFFLGQAGFVFKTPRGKIAALDPYLSDCCNRYFGFKRLMPYVLTAGELEFDQLIITHGHYDHFDPDSVPILMTGKKTALLGALDTKAECERLGITGDITYMKVGDVVCRDGIKVEAVPCDHGPDTPHALGILLTIEEKKIYIMGDTAFRPDYLENDKLHGADLLILPINGAFGNLDETQAAKAVSILEPKLAVPCHYWNFGEHGGNPALFAGKMKEICPDIPYFIMRQGEGILI